MLLWYRFKNFSSFKEDTKVSFTLKKNSSETYYDVEFEKERVTKVLAVMGANGAGKSNLLKPLAFIRWMCLLSFKELDRVDELPFYPYMTEKNEVSEIEVSFIQPTFSKEAKKDLYFKYIIKFNKHKLLHEELKCKISTDRQYSSCFYRKIQGEEQKIKVNNHIANEDESFSEREIKSIPFNSSILSYYYRKNSNFATSIIEMIDIYSNLNIYGKSHYSFFDLISITKSYFKHEELFLKAIDFIKKMDFGLDEIKLKKQKQINKESGEESQTIVPIGIHNNNGKKFELPFYMESEGTRKFYTLIYYLLVSLNNGGVAVIDELDGDLHPIMVAEILNMFKDEEINKNNAQLIFSCHTPEVLNSLKKHNVYLVEKNDCESTAWRMDDIQRLRSQDNLYNKYITGALGGIPDICI